MNNEIVQSGFDEIPLKIFESLKFMLMPILSAVLFSEKDGALEFTGL